MYIKKLNKIKDLIEKIKNEINLSIISNFLDWFYEKINIHFEWNNKENLIPKKWEIFLVNFWQNIWSELNKIRPAIIYSNYYLNWWNNLIVIPIKTLKNNFNKKIHVIIEKDNLNKLDEKSYASVYNLKEVSKKRIIRKIWNLDEIFIKKIDKKILKIFQIKIKTEE